MILKEGAITTLASQGYIKLQVPEFSLEIVGTGKKSKHGITYNTVLMRETHYGPTVDYPDEWFIFLKVGSGGKRIPVEPHSRCDRFLFLSEEGWRKNKDAIKAAFKGAIARGKARGSWEEFEARAEEHFKQLKTLGYSKVNI